MATANLALRRTTVVAAMLGTLGIGTAALGASENHATLPAWLVLRPNLVARLGSSRLFLAETLSPEMGSEDTGSISAAYSSTNAPSEVEVCGRPKNLGRALVFPSLSTLALASGVRVDHSLFGPQPDDVVRVLEVVPPTAMAELASFWPARTAVVHVEALDHRWSGYVPQSELQPIVPVGTRLIGGPEAGTSLCHSAAELTSACLPDCKALRHRTRLTVLESPDELTLRVRTSEGTEGWSSPAQVFVKLPDRQELVPATADQLRRR